MLEMKKIMAMRDLPDSYGIPNNCCFCKISMAYRMPSKMKWVSDGTPKGTKAFCSEKCRKAFLEGLAK